jgi:hypothetical protein
VLAEIVSYTFLLYNQHTGIQRRFGLSQPSNRPHYRALNPQPRTQPCPGWGMQSSHRNQIYAMGSRLRARFRQLRLRVEPHPERCVACAPALASCPPKIVIYLVRLDDDHFLPLHFAFSIYPFSFRIWSPAQYPLLGWINTLGNKLVAGAHHFWRYPIDLLLFFPPR